jgi:Ca-activated chloride channel homolog
MTQLIASFLAALFLPSVLIAQLKVDVGLVNLVATVTDDTGQYVANLSADDFVIEEDGHLQTISHFAQSRDMPVSVGIIIDTSYSMKSKIHTAISAVERFILTLHEHDEVFLMSFSSAPNLRQSFTRDRQRLGRTLHRLKANGQTALYDALVEGLRKVKDGKHRKKAILLISDGEDTKSTRTFETAALAVRESDVLVYCLGIASSDSGGTQQTLRIENPVNAIETSKIAEPHTMGRQSDTVNMEFLDRFADSGGGKAWLVSGDERNRKRHIERVLDQISAELRNQYSIGYYPPHPINDGKWHTIRIRHRDPGYHVRARQEYWGANSGCSNLPFSPCPPVPIIQKRETP